MSKKKRFGISPALTRGLSETINVVENNTGTFRNVVIPLSRIELDPENPRKLAINLEDVRGGIKTNDSLYKEKMEQLEKLKELAHTIKSNGVINPIVVYKLGEFYRVVAGERRCLASVLASKQEIEARVFSEKPHGFELKLVQWIENTAREDLTLAERLGNIREILEEYQRQHGKVEFNATLLKSILGLSLSQSSYYASVLSASEDVLKEINNGQIRNLDKAALISNITIPHLRQEAISACIRGASLKELRSISARATAAKKISKMNNSTRGRATVKIHMGSTSKTDVVRTIVESVMTKKEYEVYNEMFMNINWLDLRQASKAFRKLIEILELDMVV